MKMLGIKQFFSGKNKIVLQAFGKLPFYKDYITTLTTREANEWRAYLLNVFNKEEIRIPAGRWPFVFNYSPQSDLVVGLIEDSSDGIREFPFCIFAVCPYDQEKSRFNWDTIIEIWNELSHYRNALESKNSIDECYDLLRSKTIEVNPNRGKMQSEVPGSAGIEPGQGENGKGYLLLNYNGRWPLLLVAPEILDRRLFLLADADSTEIDLTDNWKKLSMELNIPENVPKANPEPVEYPNE